jgi:effector-binding domain-containing protein
MNPDVFDFEIGMPVQTPVEPTGRVQPLTVPSMRVVRSGYTGPYGRLSQAWGTFDTMVARAGYKTAADVWECYVKGPESGLEPDEYYTELYRPVV